MDIEVVGNDMRVVLHPFLDELETDRISRTDHALPARKVTVEVLPLYICRAKRDKDGRRILREEAGLAGQAITLVTPERAGAGQIRPLTDDLIDELRIIL